MFFLHIFDIIKQLLLLHFTFGGSLHSRLIFKNPGFSYVNLQQLFWSIGKTELVSRIPVPPYCSNGYRGSDSSSAALILPIRKPRTQADQQLSCLKPQCKSISGLQDGVPHHGREPSPGDAVSGNHGSACLWSTEVGKHKMQRSRNYSFITSNQFQSTILF